MPAARLSMKKIREILRLRFDLGRTHREIGVACGLSASTVGECLARCKREGLGWPPPDELSDSQLEQRIYRIERCKEEIRPSPDWALVHKELRRSDTHVSRFCLWEEYRKEHPDGYEYSWFCQEYRAWTATVEPVMRKQHRGGYATFVDYAGDVVKTICQETGEIKIAQIFIGVLGASSYTFAEAVWSQSVTSWIASHIRMFEFFGGTTELVVPDNLLSGVTKPNFYDPVVNPTYQKLAEHYHIAVLPTRTRKPKDKAKVENAVLIVERWILAKLRNRSFYSLDELNEAISELLVELNLRPFQKLPGCRKDAFHELDQPKLRPLPPTPFEMAEWKRAKVHVDYHIQVEGNFYSVPYKLVRQPVEVRLTADVIEVLHDGQRVAAHRRCWKQNTTITTPEHMPANHREVAGWSPDNMYRRAQQIGASCAALVLAILQSREHPENAVRSCLGVLSLARKHGNERVDIACQRAVKVGAHNSGFVRQLLKNRVEGSPQSTPVLVIDHDNIRGEQHYREVALSC
jgi:transposase